MTIAQSVLQKLQAPPPEKQQEVLDFAEFLEQKSVSKQPRQSFLGLFEHLGVQITEEDIAEARKEMWGKFPRDDI